MAGGFFISKTVGIVAIVLGLGAVATIIALSVVYAQEKNKGISDVGTSTTASPITSTSTTASPVTSTSTSTPAPSNPWNKWRLPATLKPEFYEVSLQPFLKPDANNMYIFKGNSSVVFLCEEATDLILIHSKNLNYTMQGTFHATLQAEDGDTLPAISRTWLETPTQYLVVQLNAPLQQGKRYRLSSSFTGELADDLAGFYRSEYTDASGNRKDLMVLNELHTVMATDALASSHPLSFREDEINTPAQISEVFDSIAYSKGASVLRMLSSFLSEDIFKEGLQSYLHNFSYSNTIYSDLWVHLQQAVDRNEVQLPDTISNIMDRWTLQMGFPVVTVDTSTGTIRQAHFLLDPTSSVDRPSVFNYTWIVPITWMTGSGRENTTWLTKDTDTNNDFKLTSPDWLLLNLNVTGYFRVNYNQENWNQLVKQLDTDHSVFPVINRAQIIDDAFNLARAKYVNVTLALSTTRFLSQEREYMPWQAALTNLKYFKLMFDRSEVFGAMSAYMKKQVTPLFEYYKSRTSNWTIPLSDDLLMVQYNEANAISTACSYGVTDCQNLAANYLRQWQNNNNSNPVPPNLRSAIYCSMVATGGEDAWQFLWAKFQEAPVVSEADKLRTALACSPDPWILSRYLQYTLDPTKIRKQDATSTINSIASNVVGQSLAWDFIRANWRTLFTQYGGGSFSFSRLILSVTQRFSTEFELQQLEQFKEDNQDIGFGSGTRALEQALEQTRANIKWVEENKAAVQSWFESETRTK
nr:aminopeptidase N [Zonotrichia albicollis]